MPAPNREISLIVIHCSATPNGKALGNDKRNCAEVIDGWHAERGFSRSPTWRLQWNRELVAIGYHFVIETNGFLYTGRHRGEIGAHVADHNINSLGICCVGYDKLTRAQWNQLRDLVRDLHATYPAARIVGHRDLSPDLNGDGKITSNEYIKTCPGYNVADWFAGGMTPAIGHEVEPA